ncbi:MAG: ECF transporter S component [Clostridia bacterium]|nr:ECF transporter S component [Clostridia bacterium]
MNTKNKRLATETMVLGAMMTALVVILQCLATYTTFFGPFSTAVALVPIVIGAALCGTGVGAWLGLVFGGVVILTGNAALFLAFSIPGTIVTVLCKGMACGAAAGIVHKLLKKWNGIVAAIASAIVCPIVNTGVFLLGCRIFFMPYADAIAETLQMNVSGMDLFFALAGANFLLELGMNLVLSPVIVKLISLAKKK